MRMWGLISSLVTVGSFVPVVAADPPIEEDLLEVTERLDRAPSDVEALLQRSEMYAQEGSIAEALADVRVADAVAPDDPRVATQRAAILHRLGRHDEALAEVDFAIEREPSFDALVLRARIRVRLERLAEAVFDYDAALARGDEVDIYLERGRLLERMTRWSDALRGYEQGLLATDGAIVLREAIIAICLRRGDGGRALSHVDAVLAASRGGRARWLLLRADALALLERADEARAARHAALAEIDARLRRRPSAALRVERGRALLALGRASDALAEARLARALAPRFGRATDLEIDARRAIQRQTAAGAR